MNNAEFFNLYVEKLTNMVAELTKTNILQSAQLTFYERQIASLNTKVDELQKNLDKALDKAATKQKKTSETIEF
jgi:chaperonin cofactor prefoldin